MHLLTWPALAVLSGLLLLVWSAGRFVDGAAATARHFRVPPLMIGMIIIGFGTSAPEILVSTQAALKGSPGMALGNAYGSNIANIALIVGLTALFTPITVGTQVMRQEMPLQFAVIALTAGLLHDGELSRTDAALLLLAFAALTARTVWQGLRAERDAKLSKAGADTVTGSAGGDGSDALGPALFWLLAGLGLMVLSSRLLVWGAVGIAHAWGVSDLVIGLTVIAIGTSLPELASSMMAMRKGEHELTLGSVLGSNLFNALVVVGVAGMIHPATVDAEVFSRDLPVLAALTLMLAVFGYRSHGRGCISRAEGALLLAAYGAYLTHLVLRAL